MALSPVRPHASMSVGSADTIALTRSNSPALIASMNAAEAAASGMGKLYLSGRSKSLRVMAFIIALVSAAPLARAQTSESIRVPPLGSTLTVDALANLPSSGGNLFTLLDTVIPDVITDRVDSGGLNVGGAARIGAHGS